MPPSEPGPPDPLSPVLLPITINAAHPTRDTFTHDEEYESAPIFAQKSPPDSPPAQHKPIPPRPTAVIRVTDTVTSLPPGKGVGIDKERTLGALGMTPLQHPLPSSASEAVPLAAAAATAAPTVPAPDIPRACLVDEPSEARPADALPTVPVAPPTPSPPVGTPLALAKLLHVLRVCSTLNAQGSCKLSDEARSVITEIAHLSTDLLETAGKVVHNSPDAPSEPTPATSLAPGNHLSSAPVTKPKRKRDRDHKKSADPAPAPADTSKKTGSPTPSSGPPPPRPFPCAWKPSEWNKAVASIKRLYDLDISAAVRTELVLLNTALTATLVYAPAGAQRFAPKADEVALLWPVVPGSKGRPGPGPLTMAYRAQNALGVKGGRTAETQVKTPAPKRDEKKEGTMEKGESTRRFYDKHILPEQRNGVGAGMGLGSALDKADLTDPSTVFHLAFLVRFFYTYIAHFHYVLYIVQAALVPAHIKGFEKRAGRTKKTAAEAKSDSATGAELGKKAGKSAANTNDAEPSYDPASMDAVVQSAMMELDVAVEMGFTARETIEGAVRMWGVGHDVASEVCDLARGMVGERGAGEKGSVVAAPAVSSIQPSGSATKGEKGAGAKKTKASEAKTNASEATPIIESASAVTTAAAASSPAQVATSHANADAGAGAKCCADPHCQPIREASLLSMCIREGDDDETRAMSIDIMRQLMQMYDAKARQAIDGLTGEPIMRDGRGGHDGCVSAPFASGAAGPLASVGTSEDVGKGAKQNDGDGAGGAIGLGQVLRDRKPGVHAGLIKTDLQRGVAAAVHLAGASGLRPAAISLGEALHQPASTLAPAPAMPPQAPGTGKAKRDKGKGKAQCVDADPLQVVMPLMAPTRGILTPCAPTFESGVEVELQGESELAVAVGAGDEWLMSAGAAAAARSGTGKGQGKGKGKSKGKGEGKKA